MTRSCVRRRGRLLEVPPPPLQPPHLRRPSRPRVRRAARRKPGHRHEHHGSVGNCSGGVTPWGTAISCEENFDGYGTNVALNLDFGYGWHRFGGQPKDAEYEFQDLPEVRLGLRARSIRPRRRRAQAHGARPLPATNAAFRHEPGKRFVLYMGDDRANDGVYKFVSDRRLRAGQARRRAILESGRCTSRAGSPKAGAGSRPRATRCRSARPRGPAPGCPFRRRCSTTPPPNCRRRSAEF